MAENIIEGYDIIDVLGEGGMGTVYRARQLSLDRIVALKVLSPHLVSDQEDVDRFKLESRAAAKLRHDGIVQVYDAGESNGHYFFAMDFIDGTSIDDWMQELEVIPDDETLITSECIAKALDYAWQTAKIIHRDIKPENVLVDSDGTIKLVDLGVAKMVGATGGTATSHDEIFGTPYYCSPEHATGERDLDCRTDIYSLGAMMYHMITGQLPFGDAPRAGALVKHVTEYLPDPRELNSSVSTGMCKLVAKMMAKNRDDRYSNWAEVIPEIQRVRAGKLPQYPLEDSGLSTVELTLSDARGKKKIVYTKGGKTKTKGRIQTKGRSAKVSAAVRKVHLQRRRMSRSQGPSVGAIFAVIIVLIIGVIIAISLWKNQQAADRRAQAAAARVNRSRQAARSSSTSARTTAKPKPSAVTTRKPQPRSAPKSDNTNTN